MDVHKGDIVLSLFGRDKGTALFVIDIDGEFLVLADGKGRRLEHPKRKKQKHCQFLSREDCRVSEKLAAGDRVANIDVRRALAVFRENAKNQSDDDGKTGGG